jgi:hypothetical protein
MNQLKAIEICNKLYEVLSPRGFYPAMTGGCLYKEGERKDCDIVIFRNRQAVDGFELQELEEVLTSIGFTSFQHFGFVTKAKFDGCDIDLFNPETSADDDYEENMGL